MSEAKLKQAISQGKLVCPSCGKPVKSYEKFVEMTASVWDGAGDSALETAGGKATLICGNPGCTWKERTEYYDQYIT